MRTVTAAGMRALDEGTIAAGVPAWTLMERAGRAVAEAALDMLAAAAPWRRRVVLLAGPGNNGGDAFAAARFLAQSGVDVEVLQTAPPANLRGAALAQHRDMAQAGIPFRTLECGQWSDEGALRMRGAALVVDGLLGTGSSGAPRDGVAAAIRALNASGCLRVLAIDIPSGLDADTGAAASEAVRADRTVTLGFPKRGLAMPCAVEHVGAVTVADIGIRGAPEPGGTTEPELITASDLPAPLFRRPRAAHKGSFGRVLLIGGSPGYAGAIALAARGALRSGAGLVTVVAPSGAAAVVAGLAPEAMVHTGAVGEGGSLAAGSCDTWLHSAPGFDAILIGPGLGVHRETQVLAERVLAAARVPLVVDADALHAFAQRLFFFRRATCPAILTPHPGEMGRMLGRTAAEVQRDRFAAAAAAVAASGAVVVLKGAGTIVAAAGSAPAVNLTGNPGMATGGVGDVLAGFLAGLAAQGLDPVDAARAAVYLHGLAGDLAAWRGSEPALTAGDVADALGAAFLRAGERRAGAAA